MSQLTTTQTFAKALEAYKKGKLDYNLLDTNLERFLASADGRSEKIVTEVKTLIERAGIPSQTTKLLLGKIDTREQSRGDINHSASTPTTTEATVKLNPAPAQEKTHMESIGNGKPADRSSLSNSVIGRKSTSDSRLLRHLMKWNEGDRRKTIEANETVRDTYLLESRIGVGGMGEVWKAIDLIQDAGDARDKYVAIKFLNREIRRHPDALRALVREFARYRKLIHHNIVKAYELNRDEDAVFLVMEFLPGAPLTTFIKQHPSGISLKQAKPIIKSMCAALNYAHEEGIIHLDFKPSNVFFDRETESTKVIDFGIARLAEQHDREKTKFDPGVLGAITKAYASKEMLAEAGPDPRDDVYGLACVVYELLSGQHPFKMRNAIKAEHEKLAAAPIAGLSQSQNRALLKALSFNRKDRTLNPSAFYQGLFSDESADGGKSYKQLVIGGLSVAAIVLGFLAYKGYDAWRTNNIADGLVAHQFEAVSQFEKLDLENQVELLNRAPLRKALVESYIAKAGIGGDIFGYLAQFDPAVENAVLKDSDVEEILITYSIGQIQDAVMNDAFEDAVMLGLKVTSKYPDSKRLEEEVSKIEKLKRVRLLELQRQYNRCLTEHSQSLIEALPCVNDTRVKLANILPDHELLSDTKLEQRYFKETSLALAHKKVALAEQLIADWRGLFPDDSRDRNELQGLLNYDKEVNRLVDHVTTSAQNEMPKVIDALLQERDNIRKDVLANALVKQTLIPYYSQQADSAIRAGRYAKGMGIVDKGLELFSADGESQNALLKTKQSIVRARTERLQNLNRQYWQYVNDEKIDAASFQKLHEQIKRVDSQSELLAFPGVSDAYSNRIDAAINREQFELSKRYLDTWSKIKPIDKESDGFKSLAKKHSDSLERAENRGKSKKQIEASIDGDDVKTVTAVLAKIEKVLNAEDYRRVLRDLESRVSDYYINSAQKAIKSDRFAEAKAIANDSLMFYPSSDELRVLQNETANAQSKRISELVKNFIASLNSDEVEGKTVFAPLIKIQSIDNQYLLNHPRLFERIKTRAQKLVKSEDSLPRLQSLFTHWDAFMTGITGKREEIYRKSKNYVALQCLYKGRQLKAQEKQALANEYLMFGLSLDPVSTVLNNLENELRN